MTHHKPNPRLTIIADDSRRSHWHQALEQLAGQSESSEAGRKYSVEVADDIHAQILVCDNSSNAQCGFGRSETDAVIIDNREMATPPSFAETLAGRTLPALLAGTDGGKTLNRRAVMVILPRSDDTALHAYAVGSLGLGGVFVDPDSIAGPIEAICQSIAPDETGKVAICLAGGGIEGLIYEIGVLRALDAHLENKSLVDFDIFSGISAGAVLCAFLANGVKPQEIADAFHGRPSRVNPVTRGMLFDPNFGEILVRMMGAVKDVMKGDWLSEPIASALRITPNAIFSGDKMRHYLEREFTRPGLTNHFEELAKKLYVGVTDQDTGAHVTFGDHGFEDVPISNAIRASIAMTPYYGPEQISGRYYVDGIFTRTINLDIAIANGAKMIICVDPMTPIQVDQPGFVSRRGGVFNTVQSIKSFVRTRLSEVIGRTEEAYPDVSIFVFSPTPRDMEHMSGTLMRFFYSAETEEMAYASASERIKRDYDWLAADLARHGFKLKR